MNVSFYNWPTTCIKLNQARRLFRASFSAIIEQDRISFVTERYRLYSCIALGISSRFSRGCEGYRARHAAGRKSAIADRMRERWNLSENGLRRGRYDGRYVAIGIYGCAMKRPRRGITSARGTRNLSL